MWNDGRKCQAWRRLIFIFGLLLTISVYSGATWCGLGPGHAEAATLAAADAHGAQPAHHTRSSAASRHRLASQRSSRHATSRARHAGANSPSRSQEAVPQSSDSGDLKDVTAAGTPSPETVTVLTGNVDGTAAHIAADIATVLDSSDLRVMTVLGNGATQNLRDIAASPYLDLALVPSDTLDEAKHLGLGDIAKSVTYIAPLYDEEVQILAHGNITTIHQLDGKKVGVDVAGSATSERAALVFDRLGIKPDMINLDQPSALLLLQQGMLDAIVFADGKPVPALVAVPPQGNLHFVAIPYESVLQDSYYPARIEPQDYPNLVKPGAAVETIAIGTILAAYNAPEGSPRYRKLAKFTQAFFGEFDEFHAPGRNPKWQEVNFAADAPGWKRFKPAQDWLDRSESATAAK
jgi:TRAP transporter TAXI family solute receptor